MFFGKYVTGFDVREIITTSSGALSCNSGGLQVHQRVFSDNEMAWRKLNNLFAGRWENDFYVVDDAHQCCSGGSLHRLGNKTSILRILPFLQTGQVVTSMPQILSNCSCQVSDVCLSFVTVLHVP